jgi:hypothetical protein
MFERRELPQAATAKRELALANAMGEFHARKRHRRRTKKKRA